MIPQELMEINTWKVEMKKPPSLRKAVLFVGWKTGFEPATSGTTIQHSNLLSYIHRLGVQIYKIFSSLNLLREIIPQAVEERADCIAPSRCYLRNV